MARGQHIAKLVAGKKPLQMCCACMVDMTMEGLLAIVLLDYACSGATQVPCSMQTSWQLVTPHFQDLRDLSSV